MDGQPMPASKRDDRNEWTPTVEFWLKEWPGDLERTVYEIGWRDRPIEKVEIGAWAPRRLIELDKRRMAQLGELGRRFGPRHLKLGHFSPGKQGLTIIESRR